ncbi:MAG: cell division protein [Alcaligenaceae bacterium]|nr:MAG: cell division protein [Alcaligenaceae bacterium]
MSSPLSSLTGPATSLLNLHPALWRGSQFGARTGPTIATGFAALDAELPGQGWPTGSLIELLIAQPGVGEIQLLRTALQTDLNKQPVVLLQPPYQPNSACWSGWRLGTQRLLYLAPQRARDAYWAAEQILKNGSCAALLFWAHPIQTSVLKRLHLAAQSSQTLFFMFRPHAVQSQASPAVLRLLLSPEQSGALTLSIIKRRGPACGHPVRLGAHASDSFSISSHDPVDRPALAQPQPGHVATQLAD